jgi:hypothetical protein
MTSNYKVNGIPIDRLMTTGSSSFANNYTNLFYHPKDTINTIEHLVYPLGYKINGVDISGNSGYAYPQLYTTTTNVLSTIEKTSILYKHISAVIIGGGGGAGGGGGDGSEAGNTKDGGHGGHGAPSHVYVLRNVPLSGANSITVTVGSGGAGGSRGGDSGAYTGTGNDGKDGEPGIRSSILIGSTLYASTAALGGGGGGSGNTKKNGNEGTIQNAIADDNKNNADASNNTILGSYTNYKVTLDRSSTQNSPGTGGFKGEKNAGKSGASGYVKVWFLYNPS